MLGLPSQEFVSISTSVGNQKSTNSELNKALQDFNAGESLHEFGDQNLAEKFQAAKLLMAHAEFALAQQLLRFVLSKAPASTATMRALAECAGALGAKEERFRLLEAIVRVDDHPENLLLFAEELISQGRDQEALKHLLVASHAVGEDGPLLFSIYKTIGNVFVRSRDFESAEENYHRAYRLNPNSPTLLVNFGTLEIQRENWEAALMRFREAIVLDRNCDKAWVGLAIAHRQFGDHTLSWANLARAVDINPDSSTAIQLALGWVVKDGKWDMVTEWLSEYMARNGEDATMSLALAQLWYLRGRVLDARLELTRTLALDPTIEGGVELEQIVSNEIDRRTHGRENDRRDANP